MAKNPIELLVGDRDDTKRYRRYRARVRLLPDGYRETATALERYFTRLGPSGDGAALVRLLDDLADLMDGAAADAVPVRDLVGADPVEFAEVFLANHGGRSWVREEQARLVHAVVAAQGGVEGR